MLTAIEKQNWVDALRSGEYEQCQFVLHDGKGYCCLGVLAKVKGYNPIPVRETMYEYNEFTDEEVEIGVSDIVLGFKWEDLDGEGTNYGQDQTGEEVVPDKWLPVLSKEFLTEQGQKLKAGVAQVHSTVVGFLAHLNDTGKTFAEIADWIEENVPAKPNA